MPSAVPVPPDWLFQSLRAVDGIAVEPGPFGDSVMVRAANGPPRYFQVKSIPVLSRERAEEFASNLQTPDISFGILLATRKLAEPTRRVLRSAGLSWAERLTGVCRLVGPGLLIDVTSPAFPRQEPIAAARLRDRSGWLAETLLQDREDERILLGDVARRAGISTALASRLLQRLTELHLVERFGAGPYRYWRLSDPGGLLDLWAGEERDRPTHATGLYVWSRSPEDLYKRLTDLQSLDAAWALGGPAAANLYAPTLTAYPEPTVWIPSRVAPVEVARTLRGEVVDKGANLKVWQSDRDPALRHAAEWKGLGSTGESGHPVLRLVSQPRAYLESVSGAGRSAEVAQNLRQILLAQ